MSEQSLSVLTERAVGAPRLRSQTPPVQHGGVECPAEEPVPTAGEQRNQPRARQQPCRRNRWPPGRAILRVHGLLQGGQDVVGCGRDRSLLLMGLAVRLLGHIAEQGLLGIHLSVHRSASWGVNGCGR